MSNIDFSMDKKEIQKFYSVDGQTAHNIWYLRTRARWTERAELELVRRFREGEEQPFIFGWPEEGSEFRDFSMSQFVKDTIKKIKEETNA